MRLLWFSRVRRPALHKHNDATQIDIDPWPRYRISTNQPATTPPPITKQVTRPLDHAFGSCQARIKPSVILPCEWQMLPKAQEQVLYLATGRAKVGTGCDVALQTASN